MRFFVLLLALTVQAQTVLETPRQQADGDPATLHVRGVLAFKQRDYSKAIELLKQSSALESPGSPELRESLLLLGQSYFLTNRMPETAGALERAASLGVRSNELFYMLGVAYIRLGNASNASRAIASLFSVPEDSAAAHLLTAQFMMKHEFEDPAAGEVRRALEIDAKLPGAHYLLGQIAAYRGNLDQALDEFRQELKLNPNSSMAHFKLGDVLCRREDWEPAIASLQRSIWLNPDFSGPYILLGKAYFKRKDFANAEGMLRQAIRLDPQNQSAHYLLGQTLVQAGRTEEGRKLLEKSQQLSK